MKAMKTWFLAAGVLLGAAGAMAQQGAGAGPGPGMGSGMGAGMGAGGARWSNDDTPGWSMMTEQERKEHQERIRAEYETRLAELEKERETIEEEKAQVDRYKQLLLKQRDIMILLTQRLNERDEQIVALQVCITPLPPAVPAADLTSALFTHTAG